MQHDCCDTTAASVYTTNDEPADHAYDASHTQVLSESVTTSQRVPGGGSQSESCWRKPCYCIQKLNKVLTPCSLDLLKQLLTMLRVLDTDQAEAHQDATAAILFLHRHLKQLELRLEAT